MSAETSVSGSIGFWRTVGILLRVARRRSSGRLQRQQHLLHQRTGSSVNTLGALATLGIWALMAGLNAGAAYVLYETVAISQRIEAVHQDKVIVGAEFIKAAGPLAAMLATLVLIWWLITLTFQGEGLELDLQRRRHPMWEWLFSHPVKPGAVFFAEMLSPIAANPIYSTAPIFFAIIYGLAYDAPTGLVAAILIGLPVAMAAACIGKALEIGVILRFPPRSRGALIGFMSWLGYAAMMSFLFVAAAVEKVVPTVASLLRPLATLVPWPWFAWSIGLRPDGSVSFLSGMLFWWLVAAVMITGGVWFSVWGAQRGLAGGSSDPKPVRATKRVFNLPLLRKDPLYRKEILWFLRDRGAIVQTILVPVTLAGVQLINLRGLAQSVPNSFALGYLFVLSRLGPFREMVRVAEEQASNVPNLWIGLFIVGVFFAPFAEEYLFRGLLFRALNREWGGWRALFGSAAFFAIYHPPISWLPVALVGLVSALVFKKTGRLGPSVVLHMAYNALVIVAMK